MIHEYTEDVLNTVCPICNRGAGLRCRKKNSKIEPHRERTWAAKGHRWYCFDCDEVVAKEHILSVCDPYGLTGSCREGAYIEVAA